MFYAADQVHGRYGAGYNHVVQSQSKNAAGEGGRSLPGSHRPSLRTAAQSVFS